MTRSVMLEEMKNNHLPQDAIGRYVIKEVPMCEGDNLVETVQNKIFSRADEFETINYVYVIGADNKKLLGVVSIKELVKAVKGKKIKEIMQKTLVTVRARTNRGKAVLLALQNSLKALPVINKKERFLGVVASDALLGILEEEANQDFFNFEGSSKRIIKEPILKQVGARLPWILVGLGGGIISSSVIAGFESTLLELVRLAAFIPVILNISGNVATQSAVLFVREVSAGKLTQIVKAIWHEIFTGVLIGLVSGMLLGLVAVIGHTSVVLGVIVGVTIVITQTFAAFLGLVVPWAFKTLGRDPALGTGPVVTTMMDIVAVSVYLSVAWGMLQMV